MIGLMQRVTKAEVIIEGKISAKIDKGLLVLVGIEKKDNHAIVEKLLHKLLNYRVFSDSNDKMNLSVLDIKGGLLLVPQFTLAADTNSGMRPSFSSAAPPALGDELFGYLVAQAKKAYPNIQAGQFGADMQVHLTNDGPVTFSLQV